MTEQYLISADQTIRRVADEVTEYAVFNDPEFWEPLFASGELPESQRFQLDDPLYNGLSLWSAHRYRQTRNAERGEQGKLDVYGPVVIRTRTVSTTPWRDVTYEEIDALTRV